MTLEQALAVAIEAARRAGDILRDDFHRPGGPRGHVDKAEADVEAERAIAAQLRAAFPDWRFLGEETGRLPGDPAAPIWLVDPNDGTRDYLKGRRGSAVSIGLLRDARPMLGVVYAFAHPDDDGDLFSWAEGCGPLRRNGAPLAPELPQRLGPREVVLLSGGAELVSGVNLACVAPARFRAVPSIAHRLALVAAGEAAATVSLHAPGEWDYGAGHALLRATGGALVDEKGEEVVYAADGSSRVGRAFGGARELARSLVTRDWDRVWHSQQDATPLRLARGQAVADAALLRRAHGCLLGQIAGDSLGSLVEFQGASRIAEEWRQGPHALADGGVFDTLAGQPTDDGELALALARALVDDGGFYAERVAARYRAWLDSGPFDVGTTIGAALRGAPRPDSQANGSLMRVSPLAVFAHALEPPQAAALARGDSAITHPHPVCGDATAAFVVAVGAALRGGAPDEVYAAALDWARRAPAEPAVVERLERAAHEPPVCDGPSQGWVLVALQNAFFELLHAPGLEPGVVASVRRGGDTDTNAAIAGALLGAVHGREAVPAQWRAMVLSCRAHAATRQPRPAVYWPTDVQVLAERLLGLGREAARGGLP